MISVEDRELYESAHNGYNNKYHNDHYYACCARLFDFKLPNIDENLCIAIYAEDFSIHPHFHIEDRTGFGNEYACICIDIPEYYDHGDGYNNRLTNDQIDVLIKVLTQRFDGLYNHSNDTNWLYIIYSYISEYSNYRKADLDVDPAKFIIPDYNLLKGR